MNSKWWWVRVANELYLRPDSASPKHHMTFDWKPLPRSPDSPSLQVRLGSSPKCMTGPQAVQWLAVSASSAKECTSQCEHCTVVLSGVPSARRLSQYDAKWIDITVPLHHTRLVTSYEKSTFSICLDNAIHNIRILRQQKNLHYLESNTETNPEDLYHPTSLACKQIDDQFPFYHCLDTERRELNDSESDNRSSDEDDIAVLPVCSGEPTNFDPLKIKWPCGRICSVVRLSSGLVTGKYNVFIESNFSLLSSNFWVVPYKGNPWTSKSSTWFVHCPSVFIQAKRRTPSIWTHSYVNLCTWVLTSSSVVTQVRLQLDFRAHSSNWNIPAQTANCELPS